MENNNGNISIQDLKFKTFHHPDGKQKVVTHWDYANPFADRAVYVPMERIAECLDGLGSQAVDSSGKRFDATPKNFVNQWKNSRFHVDAFIIPKTGKTSNLIVAAMGTGSLTHSAVLRYGNGEKDFMVVQCDPRLLESLLNEWKPDWKSNQKNEELVRFGGLMPENYYTQAAQATESVQFDEENDDLETFSQKVNDFIDSLKTSKSVPVLENEDEEEGHVVSRRMAA